MIPPDIEASSDQEPFDEEPSNTAVEADAEVEAGAAAGARRQSLLQRRAAPLIFVETLDRPELSADDLHHFGTVRRLADGAPITISDGRGRWCSATFGLQPAIAGPVHVDEPPGTELIVGFAPVKGERPEWVVQKLTELGVTRVVPLVSERSIVRWDAKRAAKQHHRWVAVAREAAMQSRHVWLPTVDPLMPFTDVVPSASTFVADPDGPPLAHLAIGGFASVTILIGPEGGFTDRERNAHPCRSLPGGVLRAETAALVAAAIAQAILPV